MYLHPAHVNDRLVETLGARAGRPVPRHAGPARRRRHPERRCAARVTRAAHARHRRAVPRRDPRASPCARRCWSASPARPRPPFERLLEFVDEVRVRSPRRLHVLAGGGHAVAVLRRPGDVRGRRRAGLARPGGRPIRSPGSATAKHVGQVVDVLVDGPERGPARSPGRAGRRARRRRSTASSTFDGRRDFTRRALRARAHRRGRGTRARRRARLAGFARGWPLAIATVGGVGYAPIAPGTAASAVTALVLWLLPWSPLALTVLLLVVLVVGTWASRRGGAAARHERPRRHRRGRGGRA